jgi:DNA-binding PadR family transcriptional regulator
MKHLEREVLLSFWKVHILHHAESQPVFGQWVIRELRRHGYEVSPGTLYPLLNRMGERGWLKLKVDPRAGSRARKEYSLTKKGREVLDVLRGQVEDLYREVVLGEGEESDR